MSRQRRHCRWWVFLSRYSSQFRWVISWTFHICEISPRWMSTASGRFTWRRRRMMLARRKRVRSWSELCCTNDDHAEGCHLPCVQLVSRTSWIAAPSPLRIMRCTSAILSLTVLLFLRIEQHLWLMTIQVGQYTELLRLSGLSGECSVPKSLKNSSFC